MKKPEILAPAGSMEALKAAVLAGCDAVYIGGKFFGARNFASNFDDEEMLEAIRFAHLYGVKVYVTMNTLVYEKEVENFIKYAEFLHKNNVDAIIIQDIGMMDVLRKKYPNLELHASTQMHIHNVEGVKLVESLGLKRTVVARETPIDLLKEMKKNSNIELEVFVQGALCISYSGQCLMSSLLNGRSGNRGTCSQCCRMPYDLILDSKKVNQDNYLLSPKDLNCLKHLEPLIELGIDSLKIEGRMKRKEYVYFVVSLYRKAIDSYFEKGIIDIKESDLFELKKIFNRGFTKGFLNLEKHDDFIHSMRPNHMGIDLGEVVKVDKNMVSVRLKHPLHQNDGIRILDKTDPGCIINKLYKNGKLVSNGEIGDIVSFYVKDTVHLHAKVLLTTDSMQLKNINNILETQEKKIKIKGKISCKKGNSITLQVSDSKNKIEVKTETIVEEALNFPTSKERILEQVKKTGSTPFVFDSLEYDIDDNIFVNIKDLNELRRKALDLLKEKRYYKIPFKKEKYQIDVDEFKEVKGKTAFIQNEDDYLNLKHEFDEFITDDETLYESLKNKTNILLKLPRVIEQFKDYKNNLLVGELGSINKYKNIYTDFSLNVTNSYSVVLLHSLGVKRVTLSYELNDSQIKNMIEAYKERYKKNPNLELIVSSYPEVMILKYDLLATNKVKNEAYLKDAFNHLYKVRKKDSFTTIYHFEKIEKENPNHYFDMGINKIRYHF